MTRMRSSTEVLGILKNIRSNLGRNTSEALKWYGRESTEMHAYSKATRDACREIDRYSEMIEGELHGSEE